MKAFFIQYIISFFQRKEIDPVQAKFFFIVFFCVLSWMTWSQERMSNRLDRIGEKIDSVPVIIETSNRAIVKQVYSDAEGYADKIILAITNANADVVNEIDISERRRDQLIRQINARFDGLVNEVERLKQNQTRPPLQIKSNKIQSHETTENHD